MLFSITDFLGALKLGEMVQPIVDIIPLAKNSLGWVLPALLAFVISSLVQSLKMNEAWSTWEAKHALQKIYCQSF